MTEAQIRVAVVGLGSFGRHHARHYGQNPKSSLVAVVDADPAVAREAGTAFACEALSDVGALAGRVDAVSVAVPASGHASIAQELIDAGIHVLVEKPLTVTADDARDLVDRAVSAGVVLQVGHIERFSPAVEELLARVSSPRRIACVRRSVWNGRATDVDVVLDLMIHDIDLVLNIAASPVTSVSASGDVVRSTVVDEAEVWLTFASGAVATLSASRVADRNVRRVTVTEPGVVHVADLSIPSLTTTDRARWGAEPAPVALEPRDNLGAQIDHFLSCVASGATPRVDGYAGLAAIELADRIREALADSDATVQRSLA